MKIRCKDLGRNFAKKILLMMRTFNIEADYCRWVPLWSSKFQRLGKYLLVWEKTFIT